MAACKNKNTQTGWSTYPSLDDSANYGLSPKISGTVEERPGSYDTFGYEQIIFRQRYKYLRFRNRRGKPSKRKMLPKEKEKGENS